MKFSPLFLTSVALAGGCVDSVSSDDTSDTVTPVPDDTVFTDTVVVMGSDGSIDVRGPFSITAGEQRAQNELRRAVEAGEAEAPVASLVEDVSCSGQAFWLYARTDWTGNRVCFLGTGSVRLDTYDDYVTINHRKYYAGTWGISSGSYWPGAEYGMITNRWYIDWQSEDPTYWAVEWSPFDGKKVLNQADGAVLLFQYE
jgi:hypothetical protein